MAKNLNFEEGLGQLEALVGKLEKGDTSLEAALKDFETGIALVKTCRAQLDDMDMRIEKIITEQGETKRVSAEDLAE